MNPISESSMTRFSPCTIGTVCSGLGSGQVDARCLVYDRTNSTAQCGNGVVEVGEACDCGNGACSDHDSSCCDPMTCQWRGGDQCDSSGNGNGNGNGDGDGDGDGNPEDWGYGNEALAWIHHHMRLFLGLVIGIGGAILLLVFAWILLCCCRRAVGRGVRRET